MDIYRKVFDMIEDYFGSEEEDTKVAPNVDPNAPQQFQFNPAQPSAFNFWDHFILTTKILLETYKITSDYDWLITCNLSASESDYYYYLLAKKIY